MGKSNLSLLLLPIEYRLPITLIFYFDTTFTERRVLTLKCVGTRKFIRIKRNSYCIQIDELLLIL